LLTVAVALISVRRGLAPLSEAASRAHDLQVLDKSARIDTAGLPREAECLAIEMNQLCDRVGDLVRSRERLLGRVAHALRTSLSLVLLELGKISDVRARRIEADVTAMAGTIDRLLVLARMQALEFEFACEKVDLAEVARSAVHRLEPLWRARHCTVELRANQPEPVVGDRRALQEATENLIENAIKHGPAGQTIVVTSGPGREIKVEDSGPGLAESTCARLFEAFERGDTSADGAGLGLAIVKHAVAMHRGSVAVGRSVLGGACFRLRFGPTTLSGEGDFRAEMRAS
jgi:signal transduction histidine kinase